MLWDTRKAVFNSLLEFSPALRARHHVVKLASGKWTRTLGPPGDTEKHRVVNVKGREWKQVPRTVTEDREWWQEPAHHHATKSTDRSSAQALSQMRAGTFAFGKERNNAERLARAEWEREQAARMRAAKRPVGYEHIAEMHEHTARAYEKLAKER